MFPKISSVINGHASDMLKVPFTVSDLDTRSNPYGEPSEPTNLCSRRLEKIHVPFIQRRI